VSIAKPVARKTAKKKTPGPVRKLEPPDQITLLEIRPVDVLPGETPAAAMQRALSRAVDGPAEPPADLAQCQYHDTLRMLD
jgi:hypothetical protein